MGQETSKILVVDDDMRLRSLLERYLVEQGFQVRSAANSEQMDRLLERENFHLMVLDLMLPGEDGLSICRRLRQAESKMPIIMLTAKGDEVDRIIGLEMGADDYLPKPFNHRELVARIKAIFRRLDLGSQVKQQQDLVINGIELSVSKQEASVKGVPLTLTGTEFSILRLLMVNAGELVSKEDISQQVLGRKLMAFDRSIDMHVSNLRKKISACCNDEKIKTIRGSGYLLRQQS